MLSEAYRLALLPVTVAAGAGRRLRDVSLDLAGDAALSAFDALLEDGLAEQLARRFLDGPELERMVALVLASERVDAALVGALESADAERLITRILESPLIEETVSRLVEETAARLPRSQALWALVDEVAQSPAVADAIAQQGIGLADEVAGEVRERSRAADAWLERAARRVLRRPTTPEPSVP